MDAETWKGGLAAAEEKLRECCNKIESSCVRSLQGSMVRRLFVFNSFTELGSKLDLTQSSLGTELVVFPPSDGKTIEGTCTMLELHLTVVINDIAVAIFRQMEARIKRNDKEVRANNEGSLAKAVNKLTLDRKRR